MDNSGNAILDNGLSATLHSYGGIAIGIGQYSGELELKFPSTVPANTTAYVRIDSDPDILNALLGGSLGTVLADVLGGVVFGNHYFNKDFNGLFPFNRKYSMYLNFFPYICFPSKKINAFTTFRSYRRRNYRWWYFR